MTKGGAMVSKMMLVAVVMSGACAALPAFSAMTVQTPITQGAVPGAVTGLPLNAASQSLGSGSLMTPIQLGNLSGTLALPQSPIVAAPGVAAVQTVAALEPAASVVAVPAVVAAGPVAAAPAMATPAETRKAGLTAMAAEASAQPVKAPAQRQSLMGQLAQAVVDKINWGRFFDNSIDSSARDTDATATLDAGSQALSQKDEKIQRMKELAQQKVSFMRTLDRFLGLGLEASNDWQFKYGHGRGPRGEQLNITAEILVHDLMRLTPPELDSAAQAAVDDDRLNTLNPLKGHGRLGLSIEGASFHHSFLLGNHNEGYASFYLRMSDETYFKSVKVTDGILDATIATPFTNDKGQPVVHYQRMVIDKSGTPNTIRITEWNNDSWLRTSKEISLDGFDWHHAPLTTRQTYGI